ncbi:MAG: hypothetical protein ABSF82_11735 [Candidatus Bathyarchaeia archaeon]|jgi:hypothetical protein
MIDIHGNMVKCQTCGETLIAEQLEAHECSRKPRLMQVKNIPIQYYFEMKSKEGHAVIYARTFADDVLWLEVMPVPAKRKFTPDRDDNTNHRLDRTVKLSVYRGMPYVISTSIT